MASLPTVDGPGHTVARLLLRAAVGGTMVAHGVKHARSLDGTAGWFGSIGFRQPALQARASAVVEIGTGAAIVAGAATPVAAAGVVGVMTVAAHSVHAENGFFITSEGWEYVMNLAVAAVALAGLGPGRWSVDESLGWGRSGGGARAAAVAAGLGAGAAAGQLALFHRRPSPAAGSAI
ncbi:DoxX family protein [Rhodococcus sp. BP-149]|uniref:DoxX family protein n=1 Tax=unclassified Rhodococcus (in: high G+C Gram-positive bacteria) TaxID=192944 RepID=UPI001C9B6DD5|nr:MULTISPECIES: DoxX family protein [unclassified Rhodococcus (in: high G+C Gram-positive bacteria)]MBY6687793.1 DoxX family protein [Rhodococcus sp. BP-288]MBY6696058.1 DoxX family protein [Rhodococcus sp. BP-188]MBY6700655.1 DoxX family protein [Rhodococcus sp. BP-285]MBY6705052.1 DoxX family protein [Rhodococcus sp. BP-283]MBY6713780.1 DoxX family protein [Rhodococcus sp. BP-160]